MTNSALTFDDFTPGQKLGETENTIEPDLLKEWLDLFGQNDSQKNVAQASALTISMMRAYLETVSPRPPGNIHTRQKLKLINLPFPGETIKSQIWCHDKEFRKNRNYLYLNMEGKGENSRQIYTGQMTLIWAR